jgi:hypothetical protein
MDISRIIKNILLEEETYNTEGINYQNQYQVLDLGLKNCPSLVKWIPDANKTIKELSADKTIYFPQLNAPAGSIFYVSAPYQDGTEKGRVVLFGLPFKEGSGSEGRSFKAYSISNEGVVSIVAKGWGSTCEFFKETKQLGVGTLTASQKTNLDTYMAAMGDAASLFKPTTGEYVQTPYTSLKNTKGELVLPDYKGDGYIWVQKDMVNKFTKGVVKEIEPLLNAQGFTTDFPGSGTDEGNFGFLFKDIKSDLPQLSQIQGMDDNTMIWPTSIATPDKNVCRAAIKTLSDCANSNVTGGGAGCTTNLFKNKITALLCADEKFVGGVFGLKDEYEALKGDNVKNKRFGLGKLDRGRSRGVDPNANKAPTTVRENIRKRVFNILSEEIRKKNR